MMIKTWNIQYFPRIFFPPKFWLIHIILPKAFPLKKSLKGKGEVLHHLTTSVTGNNEEVAGYDKISLVLTEMVRCWDGEVAGPDSTLTGLMSQPPPLSASRSGPASSLTGHRGFYIPIENNHLLPLLLLLPPHFPHLVLTCSFQSTDLAPSNTFEICGDV